MRLAAMRGVAAVEFAILVTVMVPLAYGVAELGRAIYQYNTIVKAVRDATRFISQHSPSDESYADAQAEARCLAASGSTDCSAPVLAPGLTTGMVTICDRINTCTGATYADVPTGSGTINLVEVRITGFTLAFMLPDFVQSYIFPSPTITFGPIRSVMRQVI
ncbi:MAG: TadE family protein [Noviherbaspirillum sp.]